MEIINIIAHHYDSIGSDMIPLKLLGLILILVGILIIALSTIKYFGGRSAGIILIGPFPIVWGLNIGKKWVKVLIAIQIVLIIIMIILIALSLNVLR